MHKELGLARQRLNIFKYCAKAKLPYLQARFWLLKAGLMEQWA